MLETFLLSLKVVEHHWMVFRKNFFSNISMTVSDPVFFSLAFGLGLGAFVQDIEGRSYLVFMAPGLAAGSALITSFFETSYGTYFRLNLDGTFKGMMTSPMGVSEIVFGELLWVMLKGAFMATGVATVFGFLGMINWSFLFLVPIVGALIGLAHGALGLIATTMVKNIDQFQMVYSVCIAPIYFLSGIFYPIPQNSFWLWNLVQISPLYHGVQLVQAALWNKNILQTFVYHFPALILLSVVLVGIAAKRFKRRLYVI